MSSSSHPIKIYHASATRILAGMVFLLYTHFLYNNLIDTLNPEKHLPIATLMLNLFMMVVAFKHAAFKRPAWEITDTGISKMVFLGLSTNHYNWADIERIENTVHPMLNKPAIGITVSDKKSDSSGYHHILLTMQVEPKDIDLYEEVSRRRKRAQSA